MVNRPRVSKGISIYLSAFFQKLNSEEITRSRKDGPKLDHHEVEVPRVYGYGSGRTALDKTAHRRRTSQN